MTREGYGKAFQEGFFRTIRFLQSRGASRDRAEEFAQAAWTKGWERLTQLRNDGLVGLWVNAIAFNQWRQAARRDALEAPLTEVRGQVGVDCAAIDADAILRRCCPREEALLRHLLHGFTTDEIAASLGASENAIRIRLLRARGSVRRRLALSTTVSGKAVHLTRPEEVGQNSIEETYGRDREFRKGARRRSNKASRAAVRAT